MLNEDNIELYLFRYKEGLLSDAEVAEVEQALEERPEWREMADLYDPELKLPKGAIVPYPDIDSLRDGGPKSTRKPVVIGTSIPKRSLRPMWITVAAAACMVLFVVTLFRFVDNTVSTTCGTLLANVVELDTTGTGVEDGQVRGVDNSEKANGKLACDMPGDMVKATRKSTMRQPVAPAKTSQSSSVSALTVSTPQEDNMAAVQQPADTSKYKIDNVSRELNDPMEQEVLYANNIIVRKPASSELQGNSTRKQLCSIAKRATSLVANTAAKRDRYRDAIGEYVDDQIESNELLSNIIATIE